MKDLFPSLPRHRLIIEAKPANHVTEQEVKDYLTRLSETLEMTILVPAAAHRNNEPPRQAGWSGWIHWVESGCHFHAWENPFPFFSVDVYSCKKINAQKAVELTKEFFSAQEIEHQEI